MSKSLAVKYRPAELSEVTEQSLIIEILKNMCEGELHCRNFLFIGPAGTGKTTISRIIGRQLNNGEDYAIEIDAASYGGVDAIRDIVKQAQSYPINSNYKIFIIDECHATSTTGWQVWLKTLEEQPAKSIFLFCTTNPEKIPATIISRVQTFQLSKISTQGIYDRVLHVIEAEKAEGRKIEYENDAVLFIAKLASGGMRSALTDLDKALAYSNNISMENISKALNLPAYDDYFSLLVAIAKKDNVQITEIIHTVYNSGVNFVTWFEKFHQFIINIVKYIFLKDISLTMIPSHYLDKISVYNTTHSTLCLRLAGILIKLNHELKITNYQQELAITYLCAPPK
jgi:DNA polymerase-3 subunit gamma/tau